MMDSVPQDRGRHDRAWATPQGGRWLDRQCGTVAPHRHLLGYGLASPRGRSVNSISSRPIIADDLQQTVKPMPGRLDDHERHRN